MPNPTNKVKYNLKNVHVVPITKAVDGTITFGSSIMHIPGAVSLSLPPSGEQNIFYADGTKYYITNGNDGYEGSLEMALIPDAFTEKYLGNVMDDKNVIVEDKDADLAHFALMFEFDGDKHSTRHILYDCVASRPELTSRTNEANIEVQTETMNITVGSVFNDYLKKNIVKSKTTADTDQTVYDSWFTNPYQPEEPPTPPGP